MLAICLWVGVNRNLIRNSKLKFVLAAFIYLIISFFLPPPKLFDIIQMCPTLITRKHFYELKVRNAGNIIPHAQHFQDEYFSCEPAGLELGCVVNDIRHIIVCGHSDCKAMNLLYSLRDPEFASKVSLLIFSNNAHLFHLCSIYIYFFK